MYAYTTIGGSGHAICHNYYICRHPMQRSGPPHSSTQAAALYIVLYALLQLARRAGSKEARRMLELHNLITRRG